MSGFKDTIKLTGKLDICKSDASQNIVSSIHVPNLVVTTGKEHVASRVASNTPDIISHMAIGSGLNVPALVNTVLGNELDRVALVSTTVTGTNIVYTATFGPGIGTGSVTEAGLFNDATAGDLLCRTTFPVITKGPSETIAISWTITVG